MVFSIIKMIGLILIGIMFVVFLLSCYLLFAPFGYRIRLEAADGAFTVRASAYDALRIVSLRLCRDEEQKGLSARLFWGLIRKDIKGAQSAPYDEEPQEYLSGDEGNAQPSVGADASAAEDTQAVGEEAARTPEEASALTGDGATGGDGEGTLEKAVTDGASVLAEEGAISGDGESAFEKTVTEEAIASAADTKAKRDDFEGLSRRFEKGLAGLEKGAAKLSALEREMADVHNQRALRHICEQTILLLKRILPEIHKADMTYGFEEPHLTGELTGVLALCPVMYDKEVRAVPDFTADKTYAEGFADIRGKVQIYISLAYVLKLFINKDCRRLYRKVRRRRRSE